MGRRSQVGNGSRAFAALLLILSMGLMTARVAAQDVTSGDAYVSVSCSVDAATGVTYCTFSAPGAEALSVPHAAVCAPVADLGAGAPDGAGITVVGSTLTLGFTTPVSAGGAATYSVTAGGVASVAAGDGLICTTEAPPGDAVPSEPAPVPAELESPPAEEVPSDEPLVEDAGTSDVDEEAEPPVSDQAIEEEAPAGDGVVEAADEETGATNGAADVVVTVMAYDCSVDPGQNDPSSVSGCVAAPNVQLQSSTDVGPLADVSTDGTGAAFITAEDGSALTIVEVQSTITAGYVPLGNGIANLTASQGAVVIFVHLLEPQVGRLQIVNGSCPTSGEERTEFRVIEPNVMQAASEPACKATGGTVFTIQGGSVGTLTAVTEADGSWRGFLPAGAYTIIDDSGASAAVNVYADEISIVVVIDYLANPLAVLNLSRQVCTDATESAVSLTGSFDAPEIGADCELADGDMTIEQISEVVSASVTTVTLGPDGIEEIEIQPGDYLITDVTSGESALFSIARSSRLYVVAMETIEAAGGTGDGGSDDGGDQGGSDGGDTGSDDGGDTGSGGGGEDPGNDSGTGGAGSGDGDGNGGDGTGGDDSAGVPVSSGGTGGDVEASGGGDEVGEGHVNDEVLGVTALPETGAGEREAGASPEMMLLALAAGGAFAIAVRRRVAA